MSRVSAWLGATMVAASWTSSSLTHQWHLGVQGGLPGQEEGGLAAGDGVQDDERRLGVLLHVELDARCNVADPCGKAR